MAEYAGTARQTVEQLIDSQTKAEQQIKAEKDQRLDHLIDQLLVMTESREKSSSGYREQDALWQNTDEQLRKTIDQISAIAPAQRQSALKTWGEQLKPETINHLEKEVKDHLERLEQQLESEHKPQQKSRGPSMGF